MESKRLLVLLVGLSLLGGGSRAEDQDEADLAEDPGAQASDARNDSDDHYGDADGLRVPHLLGWGVRLGVANSPDMVIAGANLDMGGIARRVRAEPNFEIGIGDDRTTLTATAALHYILSPERGVRPYVGAGATLGLDYNHPPGTGSDLDLRLTVRAIGGSSWVLRNRKEFFLEGSWILGALHNLQFMAGWRF
jgi:hypothetical protein